MASHDNSLEDPVSKATGEKRPPREGSCGCCSMACSLCKIGCYMCCRFLCPCLCRRVADPRPEYRVLCLGLSGAGKSTILAAASKECTQGLDPTMGYSIKSIQTSKAILNIGELGGAKEIRENWERYYRDQQGLIFVIDSTVREDELFDAEVRLEKCLEDQQLAHIPLLILFSKQNLTGARTPEDLKEKLQLPTLLRDSERLWEAHGCTSDTDMIRTCLNLLVDMMQMPAARQPTATTLRDRDTLNKQPEMSINSNR